MDQQQRTPVTARHAVTGRVLADANERDAKNKRARALFGPLELTTSLSCALRQAGNLPLLLARARIQAGWDDTHRRVVNTPLRCVSGVLLRAQPSPPSTPVVNNAKFGLVGVLVCSPLRQPCWAPDHKTTRQRCCIVH
jgi:hypothetical protein